MVQISSTLPRWPWGGGRSRARQRGRRVNSAWSMQWQGIPRQWRSTTASPQLRCDHTLLPTAVERRLSLEA